MNKPTRSDLAMEWIAEADYITRVAELNANVSEMNYDWATFQRYCRMQRDKARKEGFMGIAQDIELAAKLTE